MRYYRGGEGQEEFWKGSGGGLGEREKQSDIVGRGSTGREQDEKGKN